jgi:hypothetical protein
MERLKLARNTVPEPANGILGNACRAIAGRVNRILGQDEDLTDASGRRLLCPAANGRSEHKQRFRSHFAGPRPAGALNQQCSDAVSQSGLWAELSLEQKQRLQSKAGMIFSAANSLSNGACPYSHRK